MEKEEEARGVESEVAVDVTSPSRTETKSGKGEGGVVEIECADDIG